MLRLFRTNQLILGILLLGYALVLRFWFVLSPGPAPQGRGNHLITSWLLERLDQPAWLPAVMTTLLIWIQALLINSLVARNRLAPEVNLFPGLFYILVSSALPEFQHFSAIHLANTFVILALGQLFRVYKENRCMDNLFNMGLFIGLASLFFSPYIYFLLFLLIGLKSLRAYRLQEWLAVLIGGFLPVFWMLFFGFMKDRLPAVWNNWSAGLSLWGLHLQGIERGQWIGLVFFTVLLLVIIMNHAAFLQKTIIEVRKKIDLLYWMLFFGLISTLFDGQAGIENFLIISLPLGILLSFLFTRMNHGLAEILHMLLLFGVLLFHYLTYAGLV